MWGEEVLHWCWKRLAEPDLHSVECGSCLIRHSEHLSRRRQTGEIFSCTLNGDAGKTEAGTWAQADEMIFMWSKKNKWINKNISKKLVVLFK